MVHSTYAQGHVMGGRDIHSPLGIPKSPSFHSGLDLVASAGVEESLKKAFDQHTTTGFPGKISFYSSVGQSDNNFTPVSSTFAGSQTPLAVGTPVVTSTVSFGDPTNSFGSSSAGRYSDSHGVVAGNFFGNFTSNVFNMINGKTNTEGVGTGAGIGAMKYGIGLSAQALALQKNSTAVKSMQAMGHLPQLKGKINTARTISS